MQPTIELRRGRSGREGLPCASIPHRLPQTRAPAAGRRAESSRPSADARVSQEPVFPSGFQDMGNAVLFSPGPATIPGPYEARAPAFRGFPETLSGISIVISWPTLSIQQTASVCNASTQLLSAGWLQRPRRGAVAPLPRITRTEVAVFPIYCPDTLPSATSSFAEICSG